MIAAHSETTVRFRAARQDEKRLSALKGNLAWTCSTREVRKPVVHRDEDPGTQRHSDRLDLRFFEVGVDGHHQDVDASQFLEVCLSQRTIVTHVRDSQTVLRATRWCFEDFAAKARSEVDDFYAAIVVGSAR
jgi:hypothetical protein